MQINPFPRSSDLIERAIASDMFGEISTFADIDRAIQNGFSFAVEQWAVDLGISCADADETVAEIRPALLAELTRRCWAKLDRRYIAEGAAMTAHDKILDRGYSRQDRERV